MTLRTPDAAPVSVRVGYIGLGLMGRPIALNLVRAGHEVSVYARRAAALTPLTEAGARACDSPAALARHCDVIITNLPDGPDVEAVLFAADGAATTARPGSLVIDMSTISPLLSRDIAARLAERHIDTLDAPVSGGTAGAAAGTLSIMVGGKAAVFQRALPLLRDMGSHITHCGDHGAGQVAKACNQLVVAQTLAAVGEAFLLARAAGVDPARVREALLGGFAGSRILDVHGQRMLEGAFEPGFKARLHHKDMGIVRDCAARLGLTLPGSAQVSDYLEALLAAGQGELDSAALVQALERLNDLRIKS